ncbi:hypothetical protein [Novosphingobium sp.]|uniref:hypothetical protein n=1 Tax=Novosphingobium sp. TaxID=1874826 RepID=UPI0038B94813
MTMNTCRFARHLALHAACAATLAAMPAAAQIVADQDTTLTAINNGNVTLNGSINNPQILGGSGNAISLVSQGAVVTYDPRQTLTGDATTISNSTGAPVSVSISNIKTNAINSGSVTSMGTIDGEQSSATGAVTISAIGLQSGFAISTKPKG